MIQRKYTFCPGPFIDDGSSLRATNASMMVCCLTHRQNHGSCWFTPTDLPSLYKYMHCRRAMDYIVLAHMDQAVGRMSGVLLDTSDTFFVVRPLAITQSVASQEQHTRRSSLRAKLVVKAVSKRVELRGEAMDAAECSAFRPEPTQYTPHIKMLICYLHTPSMNE